MNNENKSNFGGKKEDLDNYKKKSFFYENSSARKCKVDLSKYFHSEDSELSKRFEIIYKIFNLNDDLIAAKLGLSRTTMNRYRRGVWIPIIDLKIKIAQIISELSNYQIDSAVIWGDDLIWGKWKKNIVEDKNQDGKK